jgi:hypothetical protein
MSICTILVFQIRGFESRVFFNERLSMIYWIKNLRDELVIFLI